MAPGLRVRPGGLRLRPVGAPTEFDLASPRLIIAGYTGRDAAAVAEHIAELAAIGVPPPASVPAFYELDPGLLTTDPVVEVSGANTSGEVEPVLIRHENRYFLGVGSDHTDRDRERHDIAASKAACPKPVGEQVIPLPADLADVGWDTLTVESAVDGTAYQRGTLDTLRTPTDLLTRLTETLGAIHGDFVIFAGTLPLLNGHFVAGTHWQLSLTVRPGDALTHAYQAKRRTA
jgi:hypothetical protein